MNNRCPARAYKINNQSLQTIRYVPDRWLDDEKRMELARYSFCGFGGGTHSCMGESFAYMQIKTILR